jgi:hypothetical protein
VAGTEYDSIDRIGYMYIGMQKEGAYAQWPDMDSCTAANQWGTFDPRFRPWYSAAASGPKNVVMVIDVSGSMSNKYVVPSQYVTVTCDSCL